jgi:hypothetical protein
MSAEGRAGRPRRRTALVIVLALLGLALLASLALLAVVARQSSWTSATLPTADGARELAELLARLGDLPYVVLAQRDGGPELQVRHELEPPSPAPVATLHALLWDARSGRLDRASTPAWAWKLARYKAGAATWLPIPEPLSQQLGRELPDVERRGPGLVLDHVLDDGRRLVIWTD